MLLHPPGELRLAPLPVALTRRGVALRRQKDSDLDFTRALYATERAAELALLPDPARSSFLNHQFTMQRAHFLANHSDADFLIVTRKSGDGADQVGRMYIDRRLPVWQLLEFALLPREQGTGVGSALLRWMIETAATARAAGIQLYVAIDNPRAEALYRRFGFTDLPSEVATRKRLELTFSAS